MRNWKEMKDDEIYSIWSGYCYTISQDYLRLNPDRQSYERRPMRLTYTEIHDLVGELLDRLEIKESKK